MVGVGTVLAPYGQEEDVKAARTPERVCIPEASTLWRRTLGSALKRSRAADSMDRSPAQDTIISYFSLPNLPVLSEHSTFSAPRCGWVPIAKELPLQLA